MQAGAERVLFVHAHPGDESAQTGGTIATLVADGVRVTVLTCTRGELGGDAAQASDAALERAAEHEGQLAEAVRILGVADHRYLGDENARWPGRPPRRYQDSGQQWAPDGQPTYLGVVGPLSLLAADPGETAADIAAVINDVNAQAVVSYDPYGGNGHPDHERVHETARRAAEVLGVPFFAIVPAEASASASMSVDVSAVLERKKSAIAAYGATPIGSIVRTERYRRIRIAREGSEFANQSTAGKIGASVLAAGIGFIAGSLLTVAHQATADVFGNPVPWGIIAAVGLTLALLLGLRLVFETRLVPGFATVGLLTAVAFLSLQGAGGSILVPANAAGYTWTFAPAIIALGVLAWPRPAARR